MTPPPAPVPTTSASTVSDVGYSRISSSSTQSGDRRTSSLTVRGPPADPARPRRHARRRLALPPIWHARGRHRRDRAARRLSGSQGPGCLQTCHLPALGHDQRPGVPRLGAGSTLQGGPQLPLVPFPFVGRPRLAILGSLPRLAGPVVQRNVSAGIGRSAKTDLVPGRRGGRSRCPRSARSAIATHHRRAGSRCQRGSRRIARAHWSQHLVLPRPVQRREVGTNGAPGPSRRSRRGPSSHACGMWRHVREAEARGLAGAQRSSIQAATGMRCAGGRRLRHHPVAQRLQRRAARARRNVGTPGRCGRGR